MFSSTTQDTTSDMVPTITEWTAYTPTIAGGFGTATSISAQWRRVGSNMEVQGSFTAGTVSAAVATITLPSGYNAINTGTFGIGHISNNAIGGGYFAGSILYNSSTSVKTGGDGDRFSTSSQPYNFFFSIPISGWAANNPAESVSFSGKVVQFITASTTATGSTATNIPFDDTIPQNTEGAEILTASITPTSASSILKITAFISLFDTASYAILALFKDSDVDALASAANQSGPSQVSISFYVSAGSTSARTYKLRGGTDSGTFYWNQRSAGRKLGGSAITLLMIEEILP